MIDWYPAVAVVGLYHTLHEKYGSLKQRLECKITGRIWKGKRWKSYTVKRGVKTSNFCLVK